VVMDMWPLQRLPEMQDLVGSCSEVLLEAAGFGIGMFRFHIS
jgi:hypothetical protein